MITVTPFETLGSYKNDWLNAHYHFSFSSYRDPDRMGLGPLRVWNDDTIAPHTGFDTHPHKDMEIITYVRSGAISHRDNLGNTGVTRAGDVQVMSAGSGIEHAEHNEGDAPTTLFQIWIHTDTPDHTPRWDTREFPTAPVNGRLPVLASGNPNADGGLMIHQDAQVLGGRIRAGEAVAHTVGTGRGAYLVVAEGTIDINGHVAPQRAGVMINASETLTITAAEDAEVVLVDVPLKF